MSASERQSRLTDKRKARGQTKVTVWLSAEAMAKINREKGTDSQESTINRLILS